MTEHDLTDEQMNQLEKQHASKNVATPKRWAAPKHDGMGKDDLTSKQMDKRTSGSSGKDDLTSKQMDKRTSGSSKHHAASERWAAPKHDGMGKGDLTMEQMNQLTKQHAAKNV